MKEKKRFLIVLFSVLFVIIGGTFAWLSWQSSETAMVLTIGEIDKVRISLSPYQLNAELIPVLDYTSEPYVEVTATNNKDSAAKFNLYYYIEELGEDILTYSSDIYYTVDRSTDGSTYNYYTGNNLIFGSVFPTTDVILEEEIPANTTYYYRVYLWLDGESENSLINTEIKVELRASIDTSDDIVVDLPEGLLPVIIADDGSVTISSEDDPDWYNYGEQKWANAVALPDWSDNYSSYFTEDAVGDKLDTSVIQAYFVYIPRYRYKIWTVGTSNSSGMQTVDIMFENVTDVRSIGTSVSEYRTHPGFTFGDAELNGIWVGKFETTGDAYTPTILPNTSPIVSKNVSAQFEISLVFAGGMLSDGVVTFYGNPDYAIPSSANSHQMKNSEWGAVAYLSHSIYGINSGVRINNYYNSGYLTGCGASTENAATSTTCDIAYGSGVSSYPQSTTGNISGIFDMSGGTWEVVMGVLTDANGKPRSGSSSTSNSGFNGTVYADGSDTSYTSGVDFPASKYYDLYTSTTLSSACNGGPCYGHSLTETYYWYGDYRNFVREGGPWFLRGARYSNTTSAGQFGYSYTGGNANSDASFRTVLIEEKSYSESILNGAAPELDDGMIPVTIDNDGTVRTISRNDPDWYSYADKKWANAILVEEDGTHTRNYYKTNVGVQVKEEDILAYYVWIPRYKYQIWNTSASSAGEGTETTINIVFEDKNTAKSTGTTVGSYITHPAFTFGTEELNGIWVGKFEATENSSYTLTVLPNNYSYVYNDVGYFFEMSLYFSGGTFNTSTGAVSFNGDSYYGLSAAVNSHMAKNSEWGAVAYLSHSNYGIGTEIAGNSYGSYTGCGDTCNYGSGISSYPQSTTGNITGVFDMSGGATEYVMGNYNGTVGSISYTVLPPEKYYDKYVSTDADVACSGYPCFGHALAETAGWYGDWNFFVSSDNPWFMRGSGYWDVSDNYAGAFSYVNSAGYSDSDYTFRSVLTIR